MWRKDHPSAGPPDNSESVSGCTSGLPISKIHPHGLPTPAGNSHPENPQWKSVKGQQDVSLAGEPSSPTYMKGDSDSQFFSDSCRTDSGFLSGANLSSECTSVEITSSSSSSRRPKDPEEGKEDPMKLDSGVDVGLPEQFSSLSLKNSSLNDLNLSSKSHSHDYTHVTNINITSSPTTKSPPQTIEQPQPVQQYTYPVETWKLYFLQDEDGDTQLHIAIIQGFIEVVYSLIRIVPHPYYLDILNNVCQTPLHLAVLTHQARIARCLLVAGANIDIRDRHGNTALHLACQIGDLECVKALIEPISVSESNTANLQYATYVQQIPQNLEERNYDGQMCVHLAAIGGHVDVLRHLLYFGANINARDGKSGRTALHYAVEYGIHRVTKFLLEWPIGPSGLQLEMPNYAGYTAYQLALYMDSALARELVNKGALPRAIPDDDSDSDFSEDEMYGISSDNYFSSHRINGEPINISA